jgi:lysophospholipase L1-like esterase
MARHVRVQPAGAGQLSYDVTSEAAMTAEDLLKLNPGTFCVTLDTGATYEAYPTGTTPPVGATTIAAVNGVWLYVSTAGTRPIIFRPGVASAGPAVATWAEVQAAIAAADGAITVYIDGQNAPAHVPAGSGVTDCQGGVVFTSWNFLSGAGGITQQILTIDDTAVLHRPRAFVQCDLVCACTTTTALTFDTTVAPTDTLITNYVGLSLSATATVSAIVLGANGRLDLLCQFSTTFDSSLAGAVPFIQLGNNATLYWDVYGGSTLLGTNTINGGGAGAAINLTHDDASALPNFVGMGFTGVVTEVRSSRAAEANPAQGTTANRPAGVQVVTGQIYFDTTIGALIEWNGTTWVGVAGTPAQPNPVHVMMVGDSNTTGAQFAGYRQLFWQTLRQRRGDLQLLGVVGPATGDGGRYVLGDWHEGGIGGSTIVAWTSGAGSYANFVATYGTPDCVLLMLGSNDLITGGMTLATMQANFALLAAAMRAATPNARVIVSSIPPRLDSGGGVAALGVAYNGALPALVAAQNSAQWSFVDGCAGQTLADLNPDTLHQNEYGSAKLGAAFAAAFNQAYPAHNGRLYPRSFMQRTLSQVVVLNNTLADWFDIHGAGQVPTTGAAFAYSMWLNPSSLSNTKRNIFNESGGNGFVISIVGYTVTLTWDNPASNYSFSLYPFWTPGQYCKLLFVYHQPEGLMSFWCNGMLIDIRGVAAPSLTGNICIVGFDPFRTINGFVGEVSDIQCSFGANVPTFAQTREVAELGYFEDEGLPNPTAVWRLNGTALDAEGGTAITLQSAAYLNPGPPMPVDPAVPVSPVTEPFIFSAFTSLLPAAAQALPPGSGASASSSDLTLGAIAPTAGSISRMAVKFTGNAANVGGQTATFKVFQNGSAVAVASLTIGATSAGAWAGSLQFQPTTYIITDTISIQITFSAPLTGAITDVMASVS